jgi:hypothetical protein
VAITSYPPGPAAPRFADGDSVADDDGGLESLEIDYGLRGWGQFKSVPLTRIDGRVRQRLGQWDGSEWQDLLQDIGLLALQYILQLAIEREAVGALRRVHYQRRVGGEAPSRNGSRSLTLRFGDVPLRLERPKFRHASDEHPRSSLFSRGRVTQEALRGLHGALIQALTPDGADVAAQLGDRLSETLASAGVDDPELARAVLSEFRSTLAGWRRRLGGSLAEARSRRFAAGGDPPHYLLASLGPPPESPKNPVYATWVHGAAEIDRYRLGHGVTDPNTVFGDRVYEDVEEILLRQLILSLRREMARPGSDLATPPPPEVWGTRLESRPSQTWPPPGRPPARRPRPGQRVITLPPHQFFSAEYIFYREAS